MEDARPPPHHVAILASPGMGHLIPLAELARRLVRHHHLAVTLITHATGHSDAHHAIVDALPEEVNVVSIPQTPVNDTSAGARAETGRGMVTRILHTMTSNLPRLRTVLESLASTTPLVAIVVDLFYVVAFDIAAELGIPYYLFFTTTCFVLSLAFHLPALDAAFQGAYKDLPEPLRLLGCVPVHGRDLMDPVHDRGSEAYAVLLRLVKRNAEARGILVNSIDELEPGAVQALKENRAVPPIYPIGPVVWSGPTGSGEGGECLNWLDEQPRGSVVYVSFGSGGTLAGEQMKELACGLEMSGQRFLWVVKSPHEGESNAAFFGSAHGDEHFQFLPEGFLGRNQGLGLVVRSWAPQTQVLAHASVGGFMTHCGWNSVLESIVNGVPMIAWPLYAEQRMNAVMLVEDVKVALRPKASESCLVGRDEIAGVMKSLMEGEEGRRLRQRALDLSVAAARALGEGGSSFRAMSDVVEEWKDHKRGMN